MHAAVSEFVALLIDQMAICWVDEWFYRYLTVEWSDHDECVISCLFLHCELIIWFFTSF